MAFLITLVLAFASTVGAVGGASGHGQVKISSLQPPSMNPAVAMYRRWTLQYEKDAVEAEKAAEMYSKMTQDVLKNSKETTAAITAGELQRIGADTWAHSAWQFEQMLTDPLPGKAALAAAKAAAPYGKAYTQYAAAQAQYNAAATGYALRVGMDQKLAKQLQTYSDQYRLQGEKVMADSYKSQATLLMKQATSFQGLATDYQSMATRIFGALPTIQNMAGQAGAYAAWQVNPANNLPPQHAFPFTIVPPLVLAQTGVTEETSPRARTQRLRG